MKDALQQSWQECLALLRANVPPMQFNAWIKPLVCDFSHTTTHSNHDNAQTLPFNDEDEKPPEAEPSTEVIISNPKRKIVQYVATHFWKQIETFFHEAGYPNVRLLQRSRTIAERLHIHDPHRSPPLLPTASNTVLPFAHSEPPHKEEVTPKRVSFRPESQPSINGLLPHYTFDAFVIGKSNQLAHAAALQVSERPGLAYNPFYLYGGVGLGKTHLVHAIGNTLAARFGHKVRYIHADDYFNEVAKAVRHNSYESFKKTFRALDVLIIDDVHFIQNRNRTQEELFYLFNALMETGRQVIVTSDRYPRDIENLQERLRSRFQWGLTVAIDPPEVELRVAILQKKAQSENIDLDTAASYYIARHLKANVRELEGALNKVLAYTQFHQLPVNADSVRLALKDIIGHVMTPLTIEAIQKAVCNVCKVRPSDMHSKSRVRNVVRARQMAMWLARELTTMSLPSIGESFGSRDHTTVLHACRTIESLRQKNSDLNQELRILEQTLRGD